MKKLKLSFISLFFLFSVAYGQNTPVIGGSSLNGASSHEKCGFNHVHEREMQNNPAYLQRTQDFEAFVRNYVPDKTAASYVIPVVVHVMETGTNMSKISDQQIRDAITGLNARMRKLTGSLGDGNGVDVQIEYALAVRDPNGNCTSGINRINMTGNSTYMASGISAGGSGLAEATLKAMSVWDQSRYYNMWFVSEIDGNDGSYGIQGFAYFSSSHGTSLDGAVMTVNTILNPGGTTLIHELGHSLNLYHTFEGDGSGNTCPTNSNCATQGDNVCDTPPHKRSQSTCTVGTNSCDGGSSTNLFIHNYMDYSNDACQNMFTAGQKTRMSAAISTTRASFLESNGNMALVPVSAPTADFYVSRSIMCSLGQTVNFYDISSCAPNTYMAETAWTGCTYSWSFTNNSGTTYTSTVQNPIITFGVAGVYDGTFTITSAQGTSTVTKQGVVVVGTNSPAAACTPSSTNNDNYGSTLSNVSFNTLNVSSSIFINNGYTNNSCTYNTVVAPSKTYVMSITVNSAGSGAEVFEAYIDYNNDGDFLDAGEQVLTGSAANSTSATITGNVTIPAGATQDRPLRMRVYADAGTLTTNEKACSAALSIGDVEDYSVYVSGKIASVSIAASPGTTTTFGTNVTFTATPTNGGTTPSYAWYKNGVLIAGATSATYATTTLINSDKIYCKMTSNLANVIASPATSNTLTMTVTGVPQSNFTVSNTTGCTSTSFAFTDATTLAPTSWSWTFTGGSPSTSSSQNPSVTYAAAGTYSVTLVATNANGMGTTMTKTNYITVTAAPTAACAPTRSLTPTNGIGITRVVLNTINNTTANNDAVVTNFSCTKTTALTTGSTYNITVMGSTTVTQWRRAYIDYNNDGDFVDAGENIWAPSNGVGTMSGSFTVPASPTLNTLLRMRVISDDATTTPGPCTTPLHYGQAEDYSVLITLGCTPVTPSVSIASSDADNVFCAGTSVTFTATPTNGGTTPSYQWKVNGGNVGTNSTTYTSTTLANSDVVTCVMTSNASCASPSTGTSTGITNTVNPVLVPAVSIASSDADNIICSGTSVTFTATPTNGGTTPSYQWKLNGGNVGTNSTTYTNAGLSSGDAVTCVMTSNATCASPATGTSSGITTTVNALVVPAVSIASSDADNIICAGTSVTFTATPTNGGTTPSYQWKLNGGNVGTNSTTYTNAALSNADAVTCVMTSNAACPSPATGTSSGITTTVNSTVTPSVVISSSDADNIICSGNSVTFTATPTNGGTTPSYQWKLNGGNVGTNSTTYTNSSLANGNTVTCVMTSNATCASPATGTSSGITTTVNALVTPAVSIASSDADNIICSGTSVTFTATPTNGGTTPSYQWKLNGGNVGTNSTTYTNAGLSSGDAVTCVMTSNATCASPATGTSSGITTTVNALVTPAVSIASSDADNIICSGTSVTFTATPTNGGTTPSYQWKLNGGNVGTNSTTYTNAALSNADAVTCVMTSNATCASPATGTSSGITTTVNSTVTPSVVISSSDADNIICAGTSVTFTATPTNGGTTPSYQWKLNGGNVGTNSTTYTNSSLANGNTVTCVMTSNATCASPATGTSSGITTTVNALVTPAVSIASSDADNIICSGTSVTFTATPTNGGTTPSYQWKLNGGNVGTNSTTYTNAGLSSGDAVTCVMTSNATCASPVTGTSSGITTTVNALVVPAVSIASSDADNAICAGTSVTFTATPTNGGTTPSYQWKLNGGNVGTNSTTYTNSSLANGNTVTCVMTSNATCASPATGTSTGISTTVFALPSADAPVNVSSCDSYTLPALGSGNYFTGSGGTGTALSAGNVISSSQTIYVYAQTGTTPNCTDEHSFVVTITASPNADAPANVSRCDSYTLPALTVGNYFTGSGGTGTALFAGNVISSSQTIYVYAQTGTSPNCMDENSFVVTITPTPTVTATTDGYLINKTGPVDLDATASAGTLNWYAASSGGAILGSGTIFSTPAITTTTTYYVSAVDNGCTSASRSAVLASIYEIKLDPVVCDVTLSDYSVPITANSVPGATNYRFRIQNFVLEYDRIVFSTTPQLPAYWVNELMYNKNYRITASCYKDGVWSKFGDPCLVRTPNHWIRLQNTSCNITLTVVNQPMYCNKIGIATNYKYLVENTGLGYSSEFIRNSADTLFKISSLSGIQFGTTYSVKVSYYYNGVWSPFGPSCDVTTPAIEPKLEPGDCNITLSAMSQDIHAVVDAGVTNYRFLVENGGLGFSKLVTTGSTLNSFKLSNVTGIVTNTTYSVKVAYYKNGLWSSYGTPCNVTSALTPMIYHSGGTVEEANGTSHVLEEIYLDAAPNPSNGLFTISSSHEGTYTLTNELGQVIRQVELTKETNFRSVVEIGQNGVYFISGVINNESVTRKVLVMN